MSGEPSPFLAEFMAEVDRIVAEHGWMVQGVGDRPPFVYSVGLARFAWGAEVLVSGLAFATGSMLINELGAMLRWGATPEFGERFYGVLGNNMPVMLVGADPGPFAVARAWWGSDRPFHTAQLLVPDANGVLPGEPGCDPQYEALQRRPS